MSKTSKVAQFFEIEEKSNSKETPKKRTRRTKAEIEKAKKLIEKEKKEKEKLKKQKEKEKKEKAKAKKLKQKEKKEKDLLKLKKKQEKELKVKEKIEKKIVEKEAKNKTKSISNLKEVVIHIEQHEELVKIGKLVEQKKAKWGRFENDCVVYYLEK